MTDTAAGPPDDRAGLERLRLPGWTVRYSGATESTNALAAADPADRLLVVTDHQTAGRGRLDRTWETPAGEALTFSAVLDPGWPDPRWPWLALLTGLAVVEALDQAGATDARIKWPNDVLLADRKVCGILLERITTPGGALAVVGVGLNVHQRRLPVPEATSLALEGVAADRAQLLTAVVTGLERLLALPEPDLAERFRARCLTLGRTVAVHLPDGRVPRGTATGVDDHGRLVVATADGPLAVAAGDVVHLR